MFTCFIKYVIDPDKITEFEEYARTWIALTKKHGGIHHGYFLPGKDKGNLLNTSFSFPELGIAGLDNIAVALFSFSDLASYEVYKINVVADPECQAITERFNATKCFLSYERSFLRPILQ